MFIKKIVPYELIFDGGANMLYFKSFKVKQSNKRKEGFKMKKILTFVVSAIITMCLSIPAFAYSTGSYKTNYNFMNARSGPGLKYSVTRKLPKGSTVNIIQISNNWGKMDNGSWIRLDAGFTSYLGGNSTSNSQYKTGTYKVLYNGTNLRSGPGLNYSVVGSANSGTVLTITKTSGEWGQTNNNSWIRLNGFARYIGNSDNSSASPTSNQANTIVSKALANVGYVETTYSNGAFWSKFGSWYGQQVGNSNFAYQPWCAMFISQVASESGIDRNTIPLFASCGVGVNWFKSQGIWHSGSGYTPKKGDIIFFTSNGYSPYHVGLVENVSGNTVYTVEGNVHDGSGYNYGVRKRSYNINSSQILGYGSPRYK